MQNNLKVLVIDDDEIGNYIAIKLIKKSTQNAVVSCELNGQRGINFLKGITAEEWPDYIFVDTHMPVMSAWDFLDEYKKEGFDAKPTTIYVMGSSVFSNDINKVRNYPFVKDFVSKPLTVNKLSDLL